MQRVRQLLPRPPPAAGKSPGYSGIPARTAALRRRRGRSSGSWKRFPSLCPPRCPPSGKALPAPAHRGNRENLQTVFSSFPFPGPIVVIPEVRPSVPKRRGNRQPRGPGAGGRVKNFHPVIERIQRRHPPRPFRISSRSVRAHASAGVRPDTEDGRTGFNEFRAGQVGSPFGNVVRQKEQSKARESLKLWGYNLFQPPGRR